MGRHEHAHRPSATASRKRALTPRVWAAERVNSLFGQAASADVFVWVVLKSGDRFRFRPFRRYWTPPVKRIGRIAFWIGDKKGFEFAYPVREVDVASVEFD